MIRIVIDPKPFTLWERLIQRKDEKLRRNLLRATVEATVVMLKGTVNRVHVITGTLRRSWAQLPVKDSGFTFESGIGSNLVYAPVEEFGFDGTIRAHTRRVKSRDKSEVVGQVTSVDKRGRVRQREVKKFTAMGVAFVHAHHRKRYGHPYVRPALAEAEPIIQRNFEAAVKAAMSGEEW